jgi:hypothetical protein
MSTNAHHCPFLNRADARCAESFSLDRLDHAFHYCFGRYSACNVYLELLIERRVRRSAAAEQAGHGNGIIQVTVHRGNDANKLHAAGVPALPGVRAGSGA